MNDRTKKTALALTGAVALASGAYAMGTQTGDGDAAAKARVAAAPMRPGPGFMVAGRGVMHDPLADRLGVTQDQLEAALRQVKSTIGPPPGADLGHRLADALGLSVDTVETALAKQRPSMVKGMPMPRGARIAKPLPAPPGMPMGMGFEADLGKALGVDAGKVADALKKVEPEVQDVFEAKLADALGVDRAKVAEALKSLDALRPKPPMDVHGHFGPLPFDEAQLARDLGVSEDKLHDALDAIRKADEAAMQKMEDEFAAALAKALNLDVQKVKDALGPMHKLRHP
jgi:biotin operon repressor